MSKENSPHYSCHTFEVSPVLRQCIPLQGYFEARIHRCKNDEHTPKNGGFNKKKNDENIL